MVTFHKTRLHVVSAVLGLLGLYALGGLGYALWVHSHESATFWGWVAVVSIVAAVAHQGWVVKKRRRTP